MAEEVKYEMSLNDLVSGKLEHAEGSAAKFETRLGHAKTAISEFGERVKNVGETLGIYLAFTEIKDFVHESIEMAHLLGQSDAQLKAGLISTNYAAGVSYEDLEESADKFAKTLPYTKAQIVDMQSQLITFPGVTRKTFETASQSILDMSTRLHKGLDETAIMVGKALQDPEKGITAMRRVGVNFNQTQTEIIKKLVETGHAGQAQKLILQELQKEFAGSAQAAANADPLFRYNKLMEDIKLSVGEAGESFLHDLTPALEEVVSAAKDSIEWIRKNEETLVDVGIVVGSAASAWLLYQGYVKGAAAAEVIWTSAIVAKEAVMTGYLVYMTAISEGTGFWTAAQWALNTAMSANPIGIIAVGIGTVVGLLVLAYKHSEKFRGVLAGIGEVAKDIGGIFKGLGEQIIGALTFNPAMIVKGFNDMANSFHDVGAAFHRGYTQSMAESAAEEAKEKAGHSTMSDLKKNAPKKPLPIAPGGKATATSKVTGSKVVNFNIQIGSLIKEFTVKTTNIKDLGAKAQAIVTEALLSAVNDSQLSAGD